MSAHPRTPKDLALPPVAIHIDENLRYLRSCSVEDVEAGLQLMLDRPPFEDTRETRSHRVLEAALRNVDLHRWTATMSEDDASIHLTGGSVSLDIGVGASVLHFIEAGRNGESR